MIEIRATPYNVDVLDQFGFYRDAVATAKRWDTRSRGVHIAEGIHAKPSAAIELAADTARNSAV